MHACLLDVATWTSPPLVVRMVESGRWSLDRGLAYARVSTLAPWKVWILASLAPRFGSLWEGAVGEEALRAAVPPDGRSEEHTSELQSLMRNSYAVFCLKKKNKFKHQ